MLNKMGEKGSPCQSPFFRLKIVAYIIIDSNAHTSSTNKLMDPLTPFRIKTLYAHGVRVVLRQSAKNNKPNVTG
jgi:hypothetical protein